MTNVDTSITVGQTATPQLAPGTCLGVLFVVDSGAVTPQSQVNFRLTARTSLVTPGTSTYPQDSGVIINSVGKGVKFTAPDDPNALPVKSVENSAQTVAAAGQNLNYKITFRNSGEVVARQVKIVDELPAGLEYVPNTLRLNTRTLSDAADSDEGTAASGRVELLIPTIAPNAVTQIEFQAHVG